MIQANYTFFFFFLKAALCICISSKAATMAISERTNLLSVYLNKKTNQCHRIDISPLWLLSVI